MMQMRYLHIHFVTSTTKKRKQQIRLMSYIVNDVIYRIITLYAQVL